MSSKPVSSCPTDYRWLFGDGGRKWLDIVAEEREVSPALAARLRKELSPERTHLVLQQVELRRRGAKKFSSAAEMFFTPVGLEQATDEVVARYKASRFPAGRRADLCCGVGGDAAAIAAGGPTICVERDRVVAMIAAENMRRLGLENAQTVNADVMDLQLGSNTFWHLDPDRRPEGHRTTQLRYHSPNQNDIERLLAESPSGVLKLAPATEVPYAWQGEAELEWIGRDRQCRQLVIWLGGLCKTAARRATVIAGQVGDETFEARSVSGSPGKPAEMADAPGQYVFEPDAAVLAADLSGSLAEEHALLGLSRDGGYLTADQPINDAAMSCFEVDELLPFDRKRIRRAINARNIGRLEIKKRGLPDDPEKLRRQLNPKGDESGVLILYQGVDAATAILARRVV